MGLIIKGTIPNIFVLRDAQMSNWFGVEHWQILCIFICILYIYVYIFLKKCIVYIHLFSDIYIYIYTG